VITEVNPDQSQRNNIVYVNEAFTKMTEFDFKEVIGQTTTILQGPLSHNKASEQLHEAMKQWQTCEIDTVYYTKSGDPYWVNISKIPVSNEKGEYTHWISIQKILQKELSKWKKGKI